MPDPSRIELRTDPLTMRLTGTTAHGLIPFDVPFISEIAPNLWQGGCTTGLILPEFFRHLVSLYPWESYKIAHRVGSALAVWMTDTEDQDMGRVDALAAWVSVCRKDGPVLVHCQAGLNRSSLVVAAALILEGTTADDAIALIRKKRSPAALCNPAFATWLRDYRHINTVSLMAPLDALWSGHPVGTLATRTCNRLRRQGFGTVGELAACTPDDLLALRDFGPGALREVQRVLGAAGLALREVAAL